MSWPNGGDAIEIIINLRRVGGKYVRYQNAETSVSQPVSRHPQIAEQLAKHNRKIVANSEE